MKKPKKPVGKKAKLAAMTPPYNKVTRGDVITAAKKRQRGKKK